MATSKTKSSKNIEAIGPSQSGMTGYDTGGGADPVNPQDRLFSGAIPVIQATSVTGRLPFSCPTRNPLHYLEGPGCDEVVTVPQRRFPRDLELMEAAGQPGREGSTGGPNESKTLGGAEIYGT